MEKETLSRLADLQALESTDLWVWGEKVEDGNTLVTMSLATAASSLELLIVQKQ